jgi:ABC-type multidrug transport system fused ATPase/permease subunit
VIVKALDGTNWEVSRRADGVSVPAAIAFVVLTVIGWVVAIVLGLPTVLMLLEIVLLLIIVLPVRREYLVAACNSATGELRSKRIRGRRRSRQAERELARVLSRGA